MKEQQMSSLARSLLAAKGLREALRALAEGRVGCADHWEIPAVSGRV